MAFDIVYYIEDPKDLKYCKKLNKETLSFYEEHLATTLDIGEGLFIYDKLVHTNSGDCERGHDHAHFMIENFEKVKQDGAKPIFTDHWYVSTNALQKAYNDYKNRNFSSNLEME